MTEHSERPENIVHWRDIRQPAYRAPVGDEELSIGSPFGRHFGFARLGIHHELLPPGRRTSPPHAEKTDDELIFVIEGTPDVWIDGRLYRLGPGDAVGFGAGTGVAHCFINNTETDVRLIVCGDVTGPESGGVYALDEEANRRIGDRYWADAPRQPLGPHDGLPDARRRRS